MVSPEAADDSNRLTFSSNGSSVILRTRIGDICLRSSEFTYYQLLFKIADLNNVGRLTTSNENSHLSTLLMRTNLTSSQIDCLLKLVNHGRKDDEGEEPTGLSFNQWLIVCKLIAHTQHQNNNSIPLSSSLSESNNDSNGYSDFIAANSRKLKSGTDDTSNNLIDENALEFIHINSFDIIDNQINPSGTFKLADFSFGKKLTSPSPSQLQASSNTTTPCITLNDEYTVEVKGWKVYGEGFHHQHIKYTILTTTTNTPLITKMRNKPIHLTPNTTLSHIEVLRRYSDFELLSNVLNRFYPGVILAPLPPKAWNFTYNVDITTTQRSRELQLFLNSVIHHPLLRHTYELKAFLEASSSGFKAFRDLFPRLHESIMYPENSSISNPNPSLLTDAIAYCTTSTVGNVVTHSKAYATISGFLTTMTNTLTQSLTLPNNSNTAPHNHNPTLESALSKLTKSFDCIILVGQRLETLLNVDGKISFEMSQMAYYLKQMAEGGHDPNLDSEIIKTCEHIEKSVQTQQSSLETAQQTLTYVQYLGRYAEPLKVVTNQKENASKAIDSSLNKESACRKALDYAKSSQNNKTGISEDNIQKLSRELVKTSENLEMAKKLEKSIFLTLESEIEYLKNIKKHELLVNVTSFVETRSRVSRENVEVWENLKKSLDMKTWRPDVSGVLDDFM